MSRSFGPTPFGQLEAHPAREVEVELGRHRHDRRLDAGAGRDLLAHLHQPHRVGISPPPRYLHALAHPFILPESARSAPSPPPATRPRPSAAPEVCPTRSSARDPALELGRLTQRGDQPGDLGHAFAVDRVPQQSGRQRGRASSARARRGRGHQPIEVNPERAPPSSSPASTSSPLGVSPGPRPSSSRGQRPDVEIRPGRRIDPDVDLARPPRAANPRRARQPRVAGPTRGGVQVRTARIAIGPLRPTQRTRPGRPGPDQRPAARSRAAGRCAAEPAEHHRPRQSHRVGRHDRQHLGWITGGHRQLEVDRGVGHPQQRDRTDGRGQQRPRSSY